MGERVGGRAARGKKGTVRSEVAGVSQRFAFRADAGAWPPAADGGGVVSRHGEERKVASFTIFIVIVPFN